MRTDSWITTNPILGLKGESVYCQTEGRAQDTKEQML